jgi:uncharacterized membrane protein YbhN (UPF0104 family)
LVISAAVVKRRKLDWAYPLMNSLVKRLLNPTVILPMVLSAALLASLLALSNGSTVSVKMATALPQAMIPVALLTLLYLVVKGIQWRFYLSRLHLRPTLPELVVPYAGGELGNSLPMGVFLENYLLKGSLGAAVIRSSVATTWMLITELVTCLLALLVVGVPGWPWVRPFAASLLVGMALAGVFVFQSRLVARGLDWWLRRAKRLRSLAEGVRAFVEAGRALFSWRTFVYGLPLTTIYLGAQVTALYMIGRALNPAFSWGAALAAFTFSLVLVLLVPMLPHLGAVEVSGVGVMLQFGMRENMAVGSFLTLRLLTTGVIILFGVLVLVLLRQQVSLVMRQLSRNQSHVVWSLEKEKGRQEARTDWSLASERAKEEARSSERSERPTGARVAEPGEAKRPPPKARAEVEACCCCP